MMPGVVAGYPVKPGPLIPPTSHIMTVGSLNDGTFWGYTKDNVPQLGAFSPELLAIPDYTMNVRSIVWSEYAEVGDRLQLEIMEDPIAQAQFFKLNSLRSVEIAGVEFLMANAVKYVASYSRYHFGWASGNILGPTAGATKTVKFNYF